MNLSFITYLSVGSALLQIGGCGAFRFAGGGGRPRGQCCGHGLWNCRLGKQRGHPKTQRLRLPTGSAEIVSFVQIIIKGERLLPAV